MNAERAQIGWEIAAAREGFVRTVSTLAASQWDEPSLCEGWTVRDVAAHVIRVGDYYRSPSKAVVGAALKGFRINRFLFRDAKKRAANAEPKELIDALWLSRYEDTRTWRMHPAPAMALGEWVIHGQDIRRALNLPHEIGSEQLRLVADIAAPGPYYPWGAPKRPAVRFEASDTDWSFGVGPVVTGPLEAIVMTLAGRKDAVKELSGVGVAAL